MINLVNLSIGFGQQDVLRGLNWQIGPKDVVGLVGNNGSGKSTLMKIIGGLVEPDEGSVATPKGVTFGYLPQDGVVHRGRTLFDEAASVFEEVRALQREELELTERMAALPEDSEEYPRIARRYSEIHDLLLHRDAYRLEEKVEAVLSGLGFSHEERDRTCDTFSGGWQMRIALAKVLLAQPNLLLLDEPTNYLDLEAREFLEGWLKGYPHAVLLVSHDRFFLDQVVNRISEIHDGKLTDYYCNYSRFLIEREERLERLRAQARRVEEERERIQAFIDRFRYKADKAALVQSRIKLLEKLEKVDLPTVRKTIKFKFAQPQRSGKIAVSAEQLVAGYGDGPDVLKSLSFQVARGEKVALVGINGAGKTTLMKVLAGKLAHRSGTFAFGYNVSFDYFAQDVQSQLDDSLTVYKTLERVCPFDLVPGLRNLLGAFLFSGDDVEKPVSVLSGGERNRLVLARMLLVPSNVLLLDEPTNHLDLDAKEVLLDALQRFEGTVLFVSHDRYFLDRLATKVFALDNGELFVYPGAYPDFLEHVKRRAAQTQAAATTEESEVEVVKETEKRERVGRWKEEKKVQRERERLTKLVTQLEIDVAAKEAGVKQLVRQMAEPQYATNFGELEKLVELKERLESELASLTDQWAESSTRLEELGGKL